jgi:hypothetical protein
VVGKVRNECCLMSPAVNFFEQDTRNRFDISYSVAPEYRSCGRNWKICYWIVRQELVDGAVCLLVELCGRNGPDVFFFETDKRAPGVQ